MTLSAPVDEPVVFAVCKRVLEEAFKRARLALAVKPLPLRRGIEEANDGLTDGDLCRIGETTAAYPNLMALSTSVYSIYIMAYGRSPEFAAMPREQIFKLKVAYQRGLFSAREAAKGMDAIETSTRASAIELLNDGRVDVVLFGYLQAYIENATELRSKTLVMWPHVWKYFPARPLLNKRNAALAPRIDAALADMQREGLIDKINADVFSESHIAPVPSDAPAAPVGKPRQP